MSKGYSKTYEVALIFDSKAIGTLEILKTSLLNAGIKYQDIIESRKGGSFRVSVFLSSRQTAQQLRADCAPLGRKGVKVRLFSRSRTSWQNAWKKNFRAFSLTRTIDVVPVWQKSAYRPGNKKYIFIDTTVVFGTGLHETTRFIARLIEGCRGKFKTFLDIGTGTGILMLVALKNGAEAVRSIDIDKGAVAVARSNLKLNGYQGRAVTRSDVARLDARKKYDFVAANLITHDVIQRRKKLASLVRPHGFLAVSGISVEQVVRVRRAFRGLSLRCVHIKKGRRWAAFLYYKVQ